jgi:hypothetical protein
MLFQAHIIQAYKLPLPFRYQAPVSILIEYRTTLLLYRHFSPLDGLAIKNNHILHDQTPSPYWNEDRHRPHIEDHPSSVKHQQVRYSPRAISEAQALLRLCPNSLIHHAPLALGNISCADSRLGSEATDTDEHGGH